MFFAEDTFKWQIFFDVWPCNFTREGKFSYANSSWVVCMKALMKELLK